MTKEQLIKKLTSRKFLLAAITAISGLITLIVGDNVIVQTIAGAAMTIVPTIVYCVMEGKIDAASVKTITDATADVAEKLNAHDKAIDTIEKTGTLVGIIVEDDNKEE